MVQHVTGKKSSAIFTQCVATVATSMVMMQTGISSGWSSPNMARLTSDNSTISLTLAEASWVASCLSLGRFASVILVPLLIELTGSKKTMLYSLLPSVISWILMINATSAWWLYVARFLGGITFGMAYACFSIFLGEVSVSKYRGTLISIATSGGPLGNVVSTIGETYLPMHVSSWIYLAMCLVTIVLFAWLADSPFQLVKTKRMEEARQSLVFYRGEGAADNALNEIGDFIETNSKQTLQDKVQQLRSAPIRKAILLLFVLFSFTQLTGLFPIIFYMEIILKKAKCFLIEPSQFVIYANIISFLSTLLAIQIIDRYGRRVLVLISGVGATLAMIMMGMHFYFVYQLNLETAQIQWVPITSIALFITAFNVGFRPVPSTVLSEYFPSSIKSTAACVASFTSALLGFVSIKSYQPMVDTIGEAYVFWMYAGYSALAVPVALFWMPETKGKSFQDIQNQLHKK